MDQRIYVGGLQGDTPADVLDLCERVKKAAEGKTLGPGDLAMVEIFRCLAILATPERASTAP